MNLEKIATNPVAVINRGDTLNRAIQYMWRLNAEHLPVMDRGRVVGMVSERDLLLHVCGNAYAANELVHTELKGVTGTTRVDAVMSSPVISLSPGDSLEKAALVMQKKGVHALPLMRGDMVSGIVTETDLLKCYFTSNLLAEGLVSSDDPIEDHMTTHIFSVSPEDHAPKAVRLMRDKQIHHVPVVHDGEVIGILAESDVLLGQKISKPIEHLSVNSLVKQPNKVASELMSSPPVTVSRFSSLRDAAEMMVRHRFGCLPVVSEMTLVGIITSSDLLRDLTRHAVSEGIG